MNIKSVIAGYDVELTVLVNNVVKGTTGSNMPYLSMTLQDASGTIEAKKWDVSPRDYDVFQLGNVVQISASVIDYREKLQLKIIDGDVASSFDASLLVPSSPVPVQELIKKLKFYQESIIDKQCKAIVDDIINRNYDEFIVHPAAVRNHHEYMNGLLHHTISMADLADAICKLYPSVDRDILISGVLLHDVGKIKELKDAINPGYTVEGKLIGHISIMAGEIKSTALKLQIEGEVPLLLEHMILSHHGKHEFGSPVLPLTREAMLLSMIDDLDAKMNILDKALNDTKEGESTAKIFAMEDRYFYKPKR